MLRLQRRAHDRVKPSRIRPLECMVRGEANLPTLHRFPVLDLSAGGAALLGRTRDTYATGQRLANCSFDLGDSGEFTADLIVRHVERAEGTGGWRFGCTFASIGARALEKVCRHVERVEAYRRAALTNEP
jgi:c-di-GMP-binding flagellar brake protein YcgR